MSKDKIGIILVNYNGEKYNEECINSIIDNNYSNIEIIVVDNASTDNSVKQLKDLYGEKINIITNKKNLGFSGANNLGIRLARDLECNYILLLNNDTVITKNSIEVMINKAYDFPKAIIVPKINYFDNKKIVWSAGGGINWSKGNTFHYGMNEVDSKKFDLSKEVEFATGCCMLIPLDIIDDIGYLDDTYFLYYEDTDYCVRATRKGYKIIYCPESLIYHKVSMSTGGGESPLYTYYIERNRLIFNKKYNKEKFNIFITYYFFTRIIKILNWALKRKWILINAAVCGIKDYKNELTGIGDKRYL